MNEKNIVDITPNIATTYQHYKVASYDFASALFEYFDNSISSFMRNPNLIKNKQIQIIIDKTTNNDQNIYIIDNAFGMTEENFIRAIRIDNPPKNEFKNKFGLGLKVASCWFSDNWSITSRSYKIKNKDTFLYHFDFDMNKIKDNPTKKNYEYSKDINKLIFEEFNKFSHGTIIKLTNVRHKFEINKSQIIKLIERIGRTYKDDIEDLKIEFKIVNLNLKNGIPMFEDLVRRVDPNNEKDYIIWFLKNAVSVKPYYAEYFMLNGEKFETNIDFTFFSSEKKYHVNGKAWWIKKSGVGKGGFDRKWKNRVIEAKKWVPEEIFGQPNGYVSQRMYGWLNFDDFEVSSNKTSFLISPEIEEVLFDELKLILEKLTSEIKNISKKEAKTKRITKEQKQLLIKNERLIFKDSFDSLNNIKNKYINTTFTNDFLSAEHLVLINDKSFTIKTEINDSFINDLISIHQNRETGLINAQINIRHPSLSMDAKQAHKVCLGLVVMQIWFWSESASFTVDMGSIKLFNKIVGNNK